jgi:2-C-methyl-D-erythritol 4-phosphate cytidylyltransferase
VRGVVLLLAAGEGSRLGSSSPKAFLELDGIPLLKRAADAALGAELVDGLVVAVRDGYSRDARDLLGPDVRVIVGGATRQASASAALAAAPDADAYLVHDAARALAPSSLFDACLRELEECEAVCPALPVTDTIKETSSDVIVRTVDRSRLVAAQTPQGFRADVYRRAHEQADAEGFDGTDDACLVERIGVDVRIIAGDDRNIKITTAHDVAVASALLAVPR